MLVHLAGDPGELHNLLFERDLATVRHKVMCDLVDHFLASNEPLPTRLSQA